MFCYNKIEQTFCEQKFRGGVILYRLGVKNTYSIEKSHNNKTDKDTNIFNSNNFIKKLFIIIPLTIIIIFLMVWASSGNTEQIKYITIEVKKGQSLWEIARINYGQEHDLRKVIYTIKKVNKLDNVVLHPGQKLKLPLE